MDWEQRTAIKRSEGTFFQNLYRIKKELPKSETAAAVKTEVGCCKSCHHRPSLYTIRTLHVCCRCCSHRCRLYMHLLSSTLLSGSAITSWVFSKLHRQLHAACMLGIANTYHSAMQMQAQEAEQRAEAVEQAMKQPARTAVKLYITSALTAVLSFAVVSGAALYLPLSQHKLYCGALLLQLLAEASRWF